MLSMHVHEHIQLDSALDIDFLSISHAHGLGQVLATFLLTLLADDAAQLAELFDIQGSCPADQVWQVEVDDVVAEDDVRVASYDQVTEGLKQVLLLFETLDLAVDYVGTLPQGIDRTEETSLRVVQFANRSDLYDRILRVLGKALLGTTLDVEAKQSQRCY